MTESERDRRKNKIVKRRIIREKKPWSGKLIEKKRVNIVEKKKS
jgi:hypothetical protein